MLKPLFEFSVGYVEIELIGFTKERFINMAAHRGISIRDLSQQDNKTTLKLSINDFRKIKPVARKSGCKFKILKKTGAPFFFYRYRKRKILLFGVLFFLASLYILSSFIWLIEFEGYERVNREELAQFVYNNGLTTGVRAGNVNRKELETLIINNFDQISFININIVGTRATVSIAEIIPEKSVIDRTTPISLVASKDALIETMAVSAGVPQVQVGDIVSKGDILVSSYVEASIDPIISYHVHASADIRALVYYTMNFSVPNTKDSKRSTGETLNQYSVNFFGRYLNFLFFRNNYKNYDIITSRRQMALGENYPLPIIFITNTFKEYSITETVLTEEQMKEVAELKIRDSVINHFDFEVDIISIETEFALTESGIDANVFITTLENIAIETSL